jgi:REP element-mobilizing transposase RayT
MGSGEAASACSRERQLMDCGPPTINREPRMRRQQRGRPMGAYTKLTYHVVFGTKHRLPLIREEFRERLFEYIGGTIRELNGHLIETGGVEDHLHILANFTPAKAVSDMIRDIKANASRWMNSLPEVLSRFEWQKGYAAFTVSYSQVPSVRQYVRNQKEHHRVTTFEEEYIAFLRRHEIEFEPRWLFEDEHHG